ncbi:MAG: lysophospholipid acyltransferase family protein [Elainellaceae cyanobacterium]
MSSSPNVERDPEFIRQLMPVLEWFYRDYFRVQTQGWEHIPHQGQVMFVGSHNGGLATPDLPMFLVDWFRRFGYDRTVYGLAHAKMWQVYPAVAQVAAKVGAIPFYARNALAVLDQGASVLVYPGGGEDAFRPHRLRDRIYFNQRTGFVRLALWHSLPIVPFISWGAHDTLIVLGDCYEQVKQIHDLGIPWLLGIDPEVFPIYLGLPWGLAVGPLPNIPWPSQIHTRVCPPIVFERTGYEASRDRAYVQACYQRVVDTMQKELDDLVQEVESKANGGF